MTDNYSEDRQDASDTRQDANDERQDANDVRQDASDVRQTENDHRQDSNELANKHTQDANILRSQHNEQMGAANASVGMLNAEHISELTDSFVNALSTQEDLVDELHRLRSSQRIMRRTFAAVLVATVLGLWASFFAIVQAQDITNLQAMDEISLESRCQIRNLAPQINKQSIETLLDTLNEVFPGIEEEVQMLRDGQLNTELIIADCNDDGINDLQDFPPGTELDIQAKPAVIPNIPED